MKNIIKKLKEIISPKDNELPFIPDYSERLLNIEKGQSFKGHVASLHLDNYNNKTSTQLTLINKYYTGTVIYSFNNKEQETRMDITHWYETPKWLRKRVYNANIIKDSQNPNINWILRDKDTEVEITEWQVTIKRIKKYQGLVMWGHRKNIDSLKELSKIGSSIRSKLKNVDGIDLAKMLKRKEENYTLCA